MDADRHDKNSSPHSAATTRLCLFAAALIPCGWAAANKVVGSVPTKQPEPPDRPSLVFQHYAANIGNVGPTSVVGARFRFRNMGKHPVHIVEARPSCGCLKPRIAKRDYTPGENGELILPVQTPNQSPGPHDYRLLVRYTDPKPREVELSLKVVLPEKLLMVQPRALAVYQLGRQRTIREIAVFDYPKLGLKLTGVEINSKLATVQLGESSVDEFGHPTHRVKVVVPAHVPPGQHRALVTITTDNKRYPRIKVPLIIYGPTNRAKTSRRNLDPTGELK